MRFLTWNILHGGGPARLPEIILSLVGHGADVVVLTEFRAARGSQVRAVLADHGLTHQLSSHPTDSPGNGILIASRLALSPAPACGLPRGRWLGAFLPALNLHLLGVHVPDDTQPGAKAAFWQELVALARRRQDENLLILGDFNTGRRFQDGPPADRLGRTSIHGCEALLGNLLSLGFVDAWRRLHPLDREFSWVSPTGEGRRIDAAYLSAPLAGMLQTAVYSQVERELGLSDHAPLLVDLALVLGLESVKEAAGNEPRATGLFSPNPVPPGISGRFP